MAKIELVNGKLPAEALGKFLYINSKGEYHTVHPGEVANSESFDLEKVVVNLKVDAEKFHRAIEMAKKDILTFTENVMKRLEDQLSMLVVPEVEEKVNLNDEETRTTFEEALRQVCTEIGIPWRVFSSDNEIVTVNKSNPVDGWNLVNIPLSVRDIMNAYHEKDAESERLKRRKEWEEYIARIHAAKIDRLILGNSGEMPVQSITVTPVDMDIDKATICSTCGGSGKVETTHPENYAWKTFELCPACSLVKMKAQTEGMTIQKLDKEILAEAIASMVVWDEEKPEIKVEEPPERKLNFREFI